MLQELLNKNRVQVAQGFDTWEEAVRYSAEPLVRDHVVEPSYVDDIVNSVKEYGPYIVIAPNIALPHARSNGNVNETGFSFLKVNETVKFGDSPEHDAKLLFTICSVDNSSHLEMLGKMVEQISDEAFVQQLLEATTLDEIKEVIAKKG